MILLDARGLAASRPDRPLFAGLDLTVSDRDRIGVVGVNGCGKTTLLRQLVGELTPEAGIVRRGRGVEIGWLPQSPVLPRTSVREAVGHGWEGEAALDRLGMAALLDTPTTALSGGQAKRVALAQVLLKRAELLILDEPTNHLDLDAVEWLEDRLAAHAGGLVLVTHDRHVLDRLTTEVVEIDRGKSYHHQPKGEHGGSGYAAYLAGRADREEKAAVAEDVRRNLARTELAWLRRGAPARTRKPQARIDRAVALLSQRPDGPVRGGSLGLDSFGGARLGSKVVELHDVSFHHPGGPDILRGVEHVIEPGDRIGVVGANGAGKSTFLDLIAGRIAPTAGNVDTGLTVRVGYYDQHGTELDPELRVRNAVVGPDRQPDYDDARLMERFWFDADAQWAPIGTLSGGERRRLQLLLVLAQRPNLLLLDEPTNDLDLDTLRALEDFLDEWPGTVMVASHDRAFLDRTVEDVLALDGRGSVALVRGGYAGWRAERDAARSGASSSGGRVVTAAAPSGERAATGVSSPPKGAVKPARTPSTFRRLLGQAERDLQGRMAARDAISAELHGATDHRRLAQLGHDLAEADAAVAAAEEAWLHLAAEAEAAGLTPEL